MTAVVATGPVLMGMGTTAGTVTCPTILTVTLAGQTSSSWATTTITTAATAIKTDSDGYTMQIDTTSNVDAISTGTNYMGGCLSGAGGLATNPVVCFYGRAAESKATAGSNTKSL